MLNLQDHSRIKMKDKLIMSQESKLWKFLKESKHLICKKVLDVAYKLWYRIQEVYSEA